ncbi:MAG TPA: helix-turn-helix domain-containing protein [bacterium]|nr:helix-turn-helix domain-containing protein [bacterium]
MPYSSSIKRGILKRILPPDSKSIRSTSKETGICEQTIRNWIKDSKSGSLDDSGGEKSPRCLSNREKYHLLMESARIPSEELGEFLRERGLHSEHLTLWDQEFREMAEKSENRKDRKMKELEKRVRELEKELNRKEKALAEAAALLILKKKLDALMEDREDG